MICWQLWQLFAICHKNATDRFLLYHIKMTFCQFLGSFLTYNHENYSYTWQLFGISLKLHFGRFLTGHKNYVLDSIWHISNEMTFWRLFNECQQNIKMTFRRLLDTHKKDGSFLSCLKNVTLTDLCYMTSKWHFNYCLAAFCHMSQKLYLAALWQVIQIIFWPLFDKCSGNIKMSFWQLFDVINDILTTYWHNIRSWHWGHRRVIRAIL